MDNLRGLFAGYQEDGQSPKCTDKGVMQSDESINEAVLQWFTHVERMENDRIPKKVFVGECAGSQQ